MSHVTPEVLSALRAVGEWAGDLGFQLELLPVARGMNNERRREILAEFRAALGRDESEQQRSEREQQRSEREQQRSEREQQRSERLAEIARAGHPEAVRVPIPTAPARRAPERPVREPETRPATTIATPPAPARPAPPPRAARPAPEPRQPEQSPRPPPRFAARTEKVTPDRAAELAAIEKFLVEKGADNVRVPGVGDPAIDGLPPLVWNNRKRIYTRDPSVTPPENGDWRSRSRKSGLDKMHGRST